MEKFGPRRAWPSERKIKIMTTATLEKPIEKKTEKPNKKKSAAYLSDMRPKFKPFEIDCGKISAYRFKGNLKQELAAKKITKAEAVNLFEDMLMIRELEEMIVTVWSGAYEPLAGYNYRGPTHVSIGQEGSSVGA